MSHSSKLLIFSAVFASAVCIADVSGQNATSAQKIKQQTAHYMGKQVRFNAKIDRILGGGVYLVSDREINSKGPMGANSKILVVTSDYPTAQANIEEANAATTSTLLKEGDWVKVQGKVEQLSVTGDGSITMPLIVAKMGEIQKQG